MFHKLTQPVVENYQKEDKVLEIDAMKSIEQVAATIRDELAKVGIKMKEIDENGPKIVLVIGGPGSGKGTQC